MMKRLKMIKASFFPDPFIFATTHYQVYFN